MDLPFMSIAVGDMLAETGGLGTEEFGAYLLIIMNMWAKPDCALDKDDQILANCARLSLKDWKRIAPRILPLFRDVEHSQRRRITQPRIYAEFERAHRKRATAMINGAKGGKATAFRTGRQSLAKAMPNR